MTGVCDALSSGGGGGEASSVALSSLPPLAVPLCCTSGVYPDHLMLLNRLTLYIQFIVDLHRPKCERIEQERQP